MVTSNDIVNKFSAQFYVDGEDTPANGEVMLSEGGELRIRIFGDRIRYQNEIQSWSEIRGIDEADNEILIENSVLEKYSSDGVTELKAQSVRRYQNEDHVPGGDVEVAIDFDITCFQTEIPVMNHQSERARKELNEDPYFDIPEEREIEYVSTDEFEIYGVPFTDSVERIEYVEEEERAIRTGIIRVKQKIDGSLAHRLAMAKEEVQKVLELSQLVQETTPKIIRSRVSLIDGHPVDEEDVGLEILTPKGNTNLGATFSQYPSQVLWGNFPEYIQEAYENYTPHLRNDLRLRQVLGYYVDARNKGRTIEGVLLSTCSAIELLSLWHAREDCESEKTREKISHTLCKLDVEFSDLSKYAKENAGPRPYEDYFWSDGRNYVSHGDPNVGNLELLHLQKASLVLLKRMIRNQLLGSDNKQFEKFYQMSVPEILSFD